jgi:hypothetical protein
MPRYYFDVQDTQGLYRDDVGLDFPHMDAAIAEARRALADMARESLVLDGATDLSIIIRDGDEGPVNLIVSLREERPRERQ